MDFESLRGIPRLGKSPHELFNDFDYKQTNIESAQ